MLIQSPPAAAHEGRLDQVQGVLRAVRRHLAMDVGFVSEFREGDRVFRFTDGATVNTPIVAGGRDPLEQSFCHYVALGVMPQLMHDARKVPVAARMPVTDALPVGAHLSVPLVASDGTPFGTICCFSFTPNHGLTKRDLSTLRLCADIVTAVMEKDRQAFLDESARKARLRAIIETEALEMVFQPLYRVEDGQLAAFEALARFPGEPRRSPDLWFAEAAEVGLGSELEFLALAKAFASFPVLDPSIKLTVNLSPASVLSPAFARALDGLPLNRVVIELTEHAVVPSYDDLRTALAPFRAGGLRLAIDDVGAGHSTFRHVLDLAPEFIKLDRSLVRGIDGDTARLALAEALIAYGRRIGCEVVAEGVETATEYAILREIGITRVQGFLTGRPMPLADAIRLPLRQSI